MTISDQIKIIDYKIMQNWCFLSFPGKPMSFYVRNGGLILKSQICGFLKWGGKSMVVSVLV